MKETLKKTLFAGFGAAVVTKETIENALHDWIAKGKVSKDEAAQFTEKLVKTGSDLWEKTYAGASGKLSEYAEKLPFARATTLAALEARITALEQALAPEAAAAKAEADAAVAAESTAAGEASSEAPAEPEKV